MTRYDTKLEIDYAVWRGLVSAWMIVVRRYEDLGPGDRSDLYGVFVGYDFLEDSHYLRLHWGLGHVNLVSSWWLSKTLRRLVRRVNTP